jgi:hypothetical protein
MCSAGHFDPGPAAGPWTTFRGDELGTNWTVESPEGCCSLCADDAPAGSPECTAWEYKYDRQLCCLYAGAPALALEPHQRSAHGTRFPPALPSAEVVLAALALVNSYFQTPDPLAKPGGPGKMANNDWTGGVYMAGNMAHFRASRNASLLEYGVAWGDSHKWQPAGYRGCHGTLGCPDNICCGQGFAEIYAEKKNATYVAALRLAIESAVQHPCAVARNDSQRTDSDMCWWWVDALFMVSVHSTLGKVRILPRVITRSESWSLSGAPDLRARRGPR